MWWQPCRQHTQFCCIAMLACRYEQICVAVMQPSGKLQVANLGDSGVRIIRNGLIVFASEVRHAASAIMHP